MSKISIFFGVIVAFVGLLIMGPDGLMMYSSLYDVDVTEEGLLEEVEEVEDGRDEDSDDDDDVFLNSYIMDPSFFEDAYGDLPEIEEFEEDVVAGILPHHLVFPKIHAEYFERLAETRDVDTFYVVGPNHFSRGKYVVTVSDTGYATPYGNLEVDEDGFEDLEELGYIGADIAAFDNEHSISSFAPFIKKSFPDAKIVPVTLKYQKNLVNFEELAEDLSDVMDGDDFLLASIDFSHMMWNNVAEFHDELSRVVIESFDYQAVNRVEIDSRPTLYTVMKFAEIEDAMHANIVNHTNSADMYARGDEIADTTSHFYVTFEEGEKVYEDGERPVTIMAFGDMMLGRFVRTLMDKEGREYPFERIRGGEDRFFEGADLFFANLEGPIYKDGYKSSTSLVFGFPEYVTPVLKKMNFGILSLANNHILNQGVDGFTNTVHELLSVGISPCGNPLEERAKDRVVKKYGGNKVGFLCFEDVDHSMNFDDVLTAIESANKGVDHLVVSVHWGYEYGHKPSDKVQVQRARQMVDKGADLILGHHPHVVQTFEIYEGVPIFYSLGNFIFDQYWSYDTEEMLAVGVVLGGESEDSDAGEKVGGKFYLFPMLSERSQPYLMDPSERETFYERFLSWGDYDEEMEKMIRSGVVEF